MRLTKYEHVILIGVICVFLTGLFLSVKNTVYTGKVTDDILKKASVVYSKGEYKDAEKMYVSIQKKNPKIDIVYSHLFWIYYQNPLKDHEDAQDVIDKYLSHFPDSVKAHSYQVILFLDLNELDKAKNHIKHIKGLDYSVSHWAQAYYYSKIGKELKTMEMLRKYLNSEKTYHLDHLERNIFITLLHHLKFNHDVNDVKWFFDYLINEQNNTYYISEAKQALSKMYLAKGDYEKAERIIMDINNACSYQALGVLYSKMNQFDDALEFYKESADKKPEDHGYQSRTALKCFNYGDYDCALKYVNNAINLKQDAIVYSELKGYVFLALNRRDDAEQIFNELKNNQASIMSKIGLAHIHIIDKDYSLAIELLNKGLKELKTIEGHEYEKKYLIPYIGSFKEISEDMANLGLGWVHANQNLHDNAIEYYNKILNIDSKHLLAITSKANSLMALGRTKEASQLLHGALEIYPDNIYLIEASD